MPKDRRKTAYRVRVEAADLAYHRHHPQHVANPDEGRYAAAHYPMSFTKGLEHDDALGIVKDPAHFEAFRHAIDEGSIAPFTTNVRVPTHASLGRRRWEAPTAGVVYDLEGPDAPGGHDATGPRARIRRARIRDGRGVRTRPPARCPAPQLRPGRRHAVEQDQRRPRSPQRPALRPSRVPPTVHGRTKPVS